MSTVRPGIVAVAKPPGAVVPDGTDRCRRPVGRRRLHLLRAGARSAGPRDTPADRRAAEQHEPSYGDASPGREPGAPGGRRVGLDIGRRSGRPGQVRRARRPSGRRRDRAGLVGDADSRVPPATRRRRARLGRPRPVPPVGEQRQRPPGRRAEADGLPAVGPRPRLRLLPVYADLAGAAQPPHRRHHLAAGRVPRATGCPAYGRRGHPDRAPVLAGPGHAGRPGPGRRPSHGPGAAGRGSTLGPQVGHVPLRPERAGVSGTRRTG